MDVVEKIPAGDIRYRDEPKFVFLKRNEPKALHCVNLLDRALGIRLLQETKNFLLGDVPTRSLYHVGRPQERRFSWKGPALEFGKGFFHTLPKARTSANQDEHDSQYKDNFPILHDMHHVY